MLVNGTKDDRPETCCLFPALNSELRDGNTQQRQRQVIELDGQLSHQGTDPSRLLQLAWAVVLHLYTACNDIAFLYVHSSANGTKLSICDVELSSDTLLSSLLEDIDRDSGIQYRPLDRSYDHETCGENFNTALVQPICTGKLPNNGMELASYFDQSEVRGHSIPRSRHHLDKLLI